MKRTQSGFTIVELLIVIVIIGVLAAITIVAYNGIQERARISSVSTALSQAAKKLSLFQVDNPDQYPAATGTDGIGNLAALGIANSGNVSYQYSTPSNGYCLTATNGTTSYKISNSNTSPAAGGCAGHSQGGVAAITNFSTNPGVEASTTGWTPRWFGAGGGAGTSTRTAAAAHGGASGYRKAWTVAGGGQDIGVQQTVAVTAGTTYTFSAYVRSSLATGQKMFTAWKNSSGGAIGGDIHGPEVAVASNTWQRLSQTLTAPAGAASAIIVWGPYPASGSPSYTVGATIDFDDFMASEGSTLPNYADGTSTNWAWTGTPHESTSTGPPQ